MSSSDVEQNETDCFIQHLTWEIQHGDRNFEGDFDWEFTEKLGHHNFYESLVQLGFLAITHGQSKILRKLLPVLQVHSARGDKELGCKTNIIDKLLYSAVENERTEIVKDLIKTGADINKQFHGKPLLHLAAESGNIEIVEVLIGAGATIWQVDKRGDSILHAVLTSQLPDKGPVSKWLIEHDADIRPKTSTGKSLLHLAATTSPDVLELLLLAGQDVNITDDVNNDTPLHLACNMSCQESVFILIKHGCLFNPVNKHGHTPLAKLMRLTNSVMDFHSKSRLNFAKRLVTLGFKMFPENHRISHTSKFKLSKGRDKVYDRYLQIRQTSGGPLTLQGLARNAVRASIASGVGVRKQVESLDIPLHLKGYILFTDKTEILTKT